MAKKKKVDPIWDNFKQIFFAVVLALIIKTSVVEAYKIPSQSMEDTLLVGDFLLANKFIYGSRLPRKRPSSRTACFPITPCCSKR